MALLQSNVATASTGKISQETARAGVEDDSKVDYTVPDMGTDTTKNWICDSVKDGGMDLSSRERGSSTQSKASASVEDQGSDSE